ncbi:hypothetical protein [Nitrososphaera sp. AFS]|uniref:hypothetical protein n=1 Tax=Nitrososphaera sp. AFS TaxID=2301191 RepID=UPI001392451E|nr:hypothetical protein [Nitrososphaera sp. AFS]NAL77146.1 hypothetical protein [Nitrososphaera sp. AFS]
MTYIQNASNLHKKGLINLCVGISSLILTFTFYSHLTLQSGENLGTLAQNLKPLASAVLLMTLVSVTIAAHGIISVFKAVQRTSNPNSLLYYITNIFSNNKYWKIMIISAFFYAMIFGFLSQIFIFRPDISFSQQGIAIPSANLITCCNVPGYVPMLSFYMTDHFLVLILPLNTILAVIVSGLVGFNIALAFSTFELSRKSRGAGKVSFLGSVGAAVGLFIGCPTCAGSLISGVLGFGFVGSISVLASFQTLFIGFAIPALIFTPFLMARSIRRNLTCASRVELPK